MMQINYDKFKELRKFRFAHRGFHNKPTIPENSMLAFKRAKERGFGVELDIHLMADGNLAVIHDASLKRTTGSDVLIEDLKKEDLINHYLENSTERIPLFEDVLKLKLPMIVELKVERGNYKALCEKAFEYLKNYKEPYCIESFDPRVVIWFAKKQPEVCRGQLAQNFLNNSEVKLPNFLKKSLTNLSFNKYSKPDFVAYKIEDRDNQALHDYIYEGGQEFSWTIRTKEDLKRAEKLGSIPIFETFDPDEI